MMNNAADDRNHLQANDPESTQSLDLHDEQNEQNDANTVTQRLSLPQGDEIEHNEDESNTTDSAQTESLTTRIAMIADEDTVSNEHAVHHEDAAAGDTTRAGHHAPDSARPTHPTDIPLYTRSSASTPTGTAMNTHRNGDGNRPERDAQGNIIVRKQGASMATIVFGSMLIVCGLLGSLMLWYGDSRNSLSFMSVDWRLALALACFAVGAVLLLSAIFWAVSTGIRRLRR
ncbi:MAG: hypothetical protein ABF780_05585 [Bifidobacterium aquikefiri]|uniref:Uncharacterized protein n=1 Tax=Bifidobacterium aquikefiri TaxID=1653207 RepID=A0A261G2A7_9BIFI|nr:hypothetical protein [Bifidobacterium aquikefiri]OZG65569.1 hypothetical protein BAQU_1752 [Bifidobacterium aquikefiri]